MKERGPGLELTLSFAFSSFFCNQVFFVYDPSSSTSLLSSVSSDQGKCERGDGGVDGGVRGPLQELTLGRLTLNRRAHKCAAAALLLCRAAATVLLRVVLSGGGPGPERELTGAAAILLRSSAARSSLITILLLQPVFFLRPWARRKLKTGTGNRDDGQ